LCLAWPDGHTETFVGRVDGTATWPPRGDKGFGYDPMFTPCGRVNTFGELEAPEKHAVSHRALAFAQLLATCLAALPAAPRDQPDKKS
jgi:XTP/dITP diphosphohydrolase